MDFRNRGAQPHAAQQSVGVPTPSASTIKNGGSSPFKKFSGSGNWFERGVLLLLISVAFLIATVAFLLYSGGNGPSDAIRKDKFQAVFLNNGQVYFGQIASLNNSSVDLRNIYYLQTSGENQQESEAAANVQLVKLGCELHAPFDQMVINNDQVLFWENLKGESQVTTAIANYSKENPNDEKCPAASQNSTQQAPATNTQAPATNTQPAPAAPTTPRRP